MALNIKENNNIVFVDGSVNASTAKQFKTHIEFLMLYTNRLTINIDDIDFIDATGIKAFRALYTKALICNMDFVIKANGCKKISQDFKMDVAA